MKKTIAKVLVVTFLATIIPTKVFATTESPEPENTKVEAKTSVEKEETPGKILKELDDKREANVKHYLLDNMTYEAVVYDEPVHYLEDGQWKDIDNSLSETKDEALMKEDEALEAEKELSETQESTEEILSEAQKQEVTKEETEKEKLLETNESFNKNENKNEKLKQEGNIKKDLENGEDSNLEKSIKSELKENKKDKNIEELKEKHKKPKQDPLKNKEKNVLENKSNNFKVKIAKKADSNKLVRISKDKYEISWNIKNTSKVSPNLVKLDENKLNKDIEEQVSKVLQESSTFKAKSEAEKNIEKQTLVENGKRKVLKNVSSTVNFYNIQPGVDLQYNVVSRSEERR